MTEPLSREGVERRDRLNHALEGRYRVLRELGEGGMATVYLAEDMKHDRRVAVKVLRPELSAVIGAERFLAEIRTTANLQHPHILPLFDSGESEGLLWYVMPHVDGESLRDRLDRERQLPVDEAVRLADGVAAALDYAHRHGVIHRDIKPANILLHDGEPLVADFGIALALSAAGGSGRMTETGLSLGTPHYMSPEQASGDGTVDPRSDVYALGCVLYEMLAGDPPFPGSSPQAVLAKVLTAEPPRVSEARPTVPPHVGAVVAKALERIPADRFATVGEMQAALKDEGFRHRSGHGPEPVAQAGGPASRGPALVALSVLSAVLLVVALVGWMRGGGQGTAPWRVFDLQVPDGGWTANESFALSPDGQLLAYIDTLRHLRVRSLSGGPALIVPEEPDMVLPRFSLDGRRLAYGQLGGSSGATVRFIPVEGASTGTLIGRVPRPDWAWGAGGELYFGSDDGARVYRRPGGPAEAPPQPEGLIQWVLQGLPDGRVLVAVGEEATPNVAVWDPVSGDVTVADRAPETVGLQDARLVGDLLFWTDVDQVLKVARFDLEGGGVQGEPVRLIQPVAPAETGSSFEVTEDGLLLAGIGLSAFRGEDENVAWVGLDGTIEVIHEGWASEFGDFDEVAPSPDGRWAAVQVEVGAGTAGPGQSQIWVLDLAQRTSYRLTFEGNAVQPVWLPDGRVVYRRDREDGTAVLMAQRYDRSGSEEVLVDPGRQIWEFDPLPDGSGLVVVIEDDDDNDNLYRVDLSDPDVLVPLLTGPFDEWSPMLSPDGRWLAYSSDETGSPQIFVRAYPEMGRPWRISTGREDGRGLGATWAPDGSRIYIAGLRNMNAYTLTEAPDGLRVQGPERLFSVLPFEDGRVWMDGAGERFLMKVEPEQSLETHLRLHLNVFDEIQRRMEAR